MRYRLMATYRGAPYEAGIGPTDGDVVLFAACPPPEELGFEPATGHWRKQLRIQDVQALWESRPMGTFRGDRCIVLDDLGDRLHIAYLGHDAYQAEQLGYWQVDRGVFELITPRDEVKEIIEERVDYPHRRGGTDVSAAPVPADLGTAGPSHAPARPSHAPAGPTHAPAGPTHAPAGPTHAPAGPTHAPAGLDFAPAGPNGATASAPQRDLAVIPPTSEAPLPLEAAARRAASARSLRSAQPAQPATQPAQPTAQPAQPVQSDQPTAQPAPSPKPGPEPPSPRRRRSALRRVATQRIFSELAGLAAIPPSAYAVGEEVEGAMCLIQTLDGFEVFNAAGGARHELRLFDDEESAYFYLFGVLAAEAVRTGRLAPQDYAGQHSATQGEA